MSNMFYLNLKIKGCKVKDLAQGMYFDRQLRTHVYSVQLSNFIAANALTSSSSRSVKYEKTEKAPNYKFFNDFN